MDFGRYWTFELTNQIVGKVVYFTDQYPYASKLHTIILTHYTYAIYLHTYPLYLHTILTHYTYILMDYYDTYALKLHTILTYALYLRTILTADD